MTEIQNLKVDQGGVNARILARQAKVDFRRVEAASLKIPTRFTSAEGKRFFVRTFDTLQLNMHFVSVIARTRLDHEDVGRIEVTMRAQIDAVAQNLDKAIDQAEALFKAHGITSFATYDTLPLDIEVHVLSAISRRFLEVLVKLDQLMPLLQTLEIHEVLTPQELDRERASLKRQVRNVAHSARNFATALRRRMNAAEESGTAAAALAAPDDTPPDGVAQGAMAADGASPGNESTATSAAEEEIALDAGA